MRVLGVIFSVKGKERIVRTSVLTLEIVSIKGQTPVIRDVNCRKVRSEKRITGIVTD